MLTVSLLLNAAVLIPVLTTLFLDGSKMQVVFGPDAPARRILASIYAAIMLVSLAGLALLWAGHDVTQAMLGLLIVQIIYKLITLATVGLNNVVVRSNVAITAVHAGTVYVSV